MNKFLKIILVLIGLLVFNEPISLLASPQSKTTQTTRQRKRNVQRTVNQSRQPATTTAKGPQTSSEAKKRQAALQREIILTEEQIRDNDAKVRRELAELGKLEVEMDATTQNINRLNNQLSKLEKEISGLEKDITTNESDLVRLREEYLAAIKKMRASRKNKSDLAFIFSSKSVNQAMRRMRYLKEFSSWKGRQTSEINQKVYDLKEEKDALAKAQSQQLSALTLQKHNKNKLAAQVEQKEMIVAELRKNGQTLETQLKTKREEARELGNMVSRLIAEEQRKADEMERQKESSQNLTAKNEKPKQNNPTPNKTAPVKNNSTDYADARRRAPRSTTTSSGTIKVENEPVAAEGFLGMKGKLPYPTTGSFTITSRFGRQNVPDMKDVEYDNPGIDAQSDPGASARAVYDGKVAGVYLLPGYNTVVIVNHGGYYTVYGNISSPSVKTGETVNAGYPLGQLAMSDDGSGRSTIHFEVWKNRDKLNPQDWLH